MGSIPLEKKRKNANRKRAAARRKAAVKRKATVKKRARVKKKAAVKRRVVKKIVAKKKPARKSNRKTAKKRKSGVKSMSKPKVKPKNKPTVREKIKQVITKIKTAFFNDSKVKVGVFLSSNVIKNLINKKYDKTSFSYQRIEELFKASEVTKVNLFLFSARDVSLKDKYIRGTIREAGKWKKARVPFPDVLYERASHKNKNTDLVKAKFDKLKIKKLNSVSYFNKWDVYAKLSKNKNVKHYLPETRVFKGFAELEEFLDKHKHVYLKGVRGGRGRRILFIKKKNDESYEYSYYHEHLFIGKHDSYLKLQKTIKDFFKGRSFVMQESIELLKLGKSNIDCRAEVQRNGYGDLVITGVSARVGIPNAPITIHSAAYKLEEFFEKYFHYSPNEIDELVEKVNTFLYEIYHALEEAYGPYGEIGIDFGINTEGKIIFIEPNAKSAKVSLMKAYSRDQYKYAFINPIAYAKYITTTSRR